MSSLSGISGLGMGWPTNSTSMPAAVPSGEPAASDSLNLSAMAYSSASISASSESLSISSGGGISAASTNELLGAVLLLLTLEYMKSDNDQEKKDLLGLMTTLAQQMGQNGGSGGESISYTSSSLSIEMSSLQVVSIDAGLGSYLQGDSGQAPGAAGIDVAA